MFLIQELDPSTPSKVKSRGSELWPTLNRITMSVILAPGVSTLIEKSWRMLSISWG